MAVNIAAAVHQIKHNLDNHITPDDILDACQAVGHEWRERRLGPVITVWTLLLQVLHNTAMTCVSRLVGVSFSAATYCQALQRLPLDILRTLLRQFVTRQHDATGDLLVADRGFCSFAHLALPRQRGIEALIRVHGQRHLRGGVLLIMRRRVGKREGTPWTVRARRDPHANDSLSIPTVFNPRAQPARNGLRGSRPN